MPKPRPTATSASTAIFYQPPRENPLLEQVERSLPLSPAMIGTKGLFLECYAPNGASRILDGKGRIEDILNNYAYMSFNIGPPCSRGWKRSIPIPTRASWTRPAKLRTSGRPRQRHRPGLQPRDHASGHAGTETPPDQMGHRRFRNAVSHRKPEGMWLAETAVNMDTGSP